MANNNTTVKQLYSCDGATQDFAIPFFFIEGEESVIKVYLVNDATGIATPLVLTADYTLDTPATSVHTIATYAGGQSILVKRESPRTQLSEYSVGPFPAETIEEQFDRNMCVLQELGDEQSMFIALPDGSPLANLKLPVPEADKLIGWNATADALENKNISDIPAIQSDISILQGKVTVLEGQVADDAIHDIAQDSRLDNHDTAIAGIVQDVADLEVVVIATGATMANFPADIANLQSQINLINDRGADVDALLVTTAEHEVRLDVVEPTVVEHANRISLLEASSNVSQFSGSIDILNNQLVPVAIVNPFSPANDFKRDADGTQLAMVDIQIDRRTDSELRFTRVRLIMRYITETGLWYIVRENTTAFIGESDGVEFTIETDINNVGQVYYTSDNMAGANYSGKLKFLGKEIPTGV